MASKNITNPEFQRMSQARYIPHRPVLPSTIPRRSCL